MHEEVKWIARGSIQPSTTPTRQNPSEESNKSLEKKGSQPKVTKAKEC